MKIFISYRREDSLTTAAFLRAELALRYEAENVFMDVTDIEPGDNFGAVITRHLELVDVVLIVIGPHWAETLLRRSESEECDWVRFEIRTALQLRAQSAARDGEQTVRPKVIPVLVQRAELPVDKLPDDIAPLLALNMHRLIEAHLAVSLVALVESINGRRDEDVVKELEARIRRRTRAQVVGALTGLAMFLAGWLALFDYFGIDTRVTSQLIRLANAVAAPAPWTDRVALVVIDKKTLAALGRHEFDATWRGDHARLITLASAAGARAIAFDLTFEEEGDEASDAALEQALAAVHGTLPVVFGVQRFADAAPVVLARFAQHASLGIACAGVKLGQVRSMPLVVQREAVPDSAATDRQAMPKAHPSLALAAFSGGGHVQPLEPLKQTVQVMIPREERSVDIAYFAAETVRTMQRDCQAIVQGDRVASQLVDARTLPPSLAYENVIDADPASLALMRDRIVLVGVHLDIDRLPTDASTPVWGVDLIAAQIDAMAGGTVIRPLGALAQWLVMTAMGLVGAIVSNRLQTRSGALRWVGLAVLTAIGGLFVAGAIYWYRMEHQLVGVPYGLVALAVGAWIAQRARKRSFS